MRVFIDTNIYSKLFTPAGDQSDYIGKLVKLINDKRIAIVFPKITQSELLRNIGDTNEIISEYKRNLEKAKAKRILGT